MKRLELCAPAEIYLFLFTFQGLHMGEVRAATRLLALTTVNRDSPSCSEQELYLYNIAFWMTLKSKDRLHFLRRLKMKSIIDKSSQYHVDSLFHQMVNSWGLLQIALKPPASPPSTIMLLLIALNLEVGTFKSFVLLRINSSYSAYL